MKQFIILLLASHCFISGMQIGWDNYKLELIDSLQKGALEQRAEKRILITKNQLEQALNAVTWATRKKGTGGKLIAVYVYEGTEEFRGAFANPTSESYRGLGDLMVYLAQKKFMPAQEKGSSARMPEPSLQALSPEVVVISYQYGSKDPKKNAEEEKNNKARLLADFVASLPVLFGTEAKIVVVAKGESTDIVNRATHRTGINTIDTLLYFQAPIYEWEWTGQYVYNTDLAPAGFKHLYHFYSKAGFTPKPFNPERKFKQQYRVDGNTFLMPVKNVRMLKVNNSNELEDFSETDFLAPQAIKNYPRLLEQIDDYRLNFDLIAKGFSERGQQETAVAVNRFVIFDKNTLIATYGSSAIAKEKNYTIAELSPAQLLQLKKQFAAEVRKSNEQLALIMNFKAAQGWISYLSAGYVTQLELSQELKNIFQRNQAELKGLGQ